MGWTKRVLDEVRGEVAPPDDTLKAARERRDAVKDAASTFEGILRTYNAGSLAHGTANADLDADCGVVLDRTAYPDLGPDGENEGPNDVVQEVRGHAREQLRQVYPDVSFRLTHRAIEVSFHEPLADGSDPTVDLIVALNRREAPGLWIPHLVRRNWDASHPEEHTRLLTAPPQPFRVVRARVVRLGKAWNALFSDPGLSSFNIEALALECIQSRHHVDDGLAELFRYAAAELSHHNTSDPAGVSPPIKILIDRDKLVGRLRRARDLMKQALEHDDDEKLVREALASLFPAYVKPLKGDSKAAIAAALAQQTARFGSTVTTDLERGRPITRSRSFGGRRPR